MGTAHSTGLLPWPTLQKKAVSGAVEICEDAGAEVEVSASSDRDDRAAALCFQILKGARHEQKVEGLQLEGGSSSSSVAEVFRDLSATEEGRTEDAKVS